MEEKQVEVNQKVKLEVVVNKSSMINHKGGEMIENIID